MLATLKRITARREDGTDKDQGFTLIELLVVIVIVGILAAIAIPVFLNQRQKAVDSGLKSDLKAAATTVETWIVDNPSTTITADTAGATGTGILDDFKPTSGNTVILKPATGGGYTICAFNPKASEATAADANKNMYYDSANGGLQSTLNTAGCSAS
ncbi:type IV pilin protein [Nocardioides sambongensis]|uniref:type IV pilin protein n=1 Tax=Nocardioides sambongensis TaxID=2589074 RepID=UPI001E28DE3E|nr:prepilin-type N-terminal cleavage/methylation domain-containing protein [Nocardioides sambongensis]